MSEQGQQGQHQASGVGRSWFASPNRERDPGAEMHRHRECAGRVLRDSMGCEPSRMGDAFRPPSPAPFAVVTEPAPLRELERFLGRQSFRQGAGPCLLGHPTQCASTSSPASYQYINYTKSQYNIDYLGSVNSRTWLCKLKSSGSHRSNTIGFHCWARTANGPGVAHDLVARHGGVTSSQAAPRCVPTSVLKLKVAQRICLPRLTLRQT
jgi:hypothetical protein